jgi:pimeloyl-ACP methyl ester carboxylesterase
LHYQAWGAGDPVIALHALALESSMFAGVARELALQGYRTLAADLPGFGRTPPPVGPLTPQRLAEPVIELARSLGTPPLLLGMSLGGRVALEAALLEPDAFRGVVLVAPFLPWRKARWALALARAIDPTWSDRLPLERAWPWLKKAADAIEGIPQLEHNWLARASVRVIYYSSCPATRASFLSASREMALDPAFGPQGLWTRLAQLRTPASFLWAGRDHLIPRHHAARVAETIPRALWLEVPCAGHFVNGSHYRCLEHAMALAVVHTADAARSLPSSPSDRPLLTPCLSGEGPLPPEGVAEESARARDERRSAEGGSR